MNTMIAKWMRFLAVAAVALLVASCNKPPAGTFETPEQAVQALDALIGKQDQAGVEAMFGPGSMEMFSSGDDNEDAVAAEKVKALIAEGVTFEDYDDKTKLALFGKKEWPFPIPLVKDGERWRFDTANGKEELLNRRIGHNELQTLATLHEVVDAQREYFAVGRDGNAPAFAQKFLSSEGKHDGLYWPPEDENAELSPLGDMVANSDVTAAAGEPYYGYYYRMLSSQGANAPGGAKDYKNAEGLMAGGFAVIAWPAKHGNSGVMSFLMNQQGIVFQKDLGADTEAAAKAITAFDPDASWTPTGDTDEGEEDEDGAEAAAAAGDEPQEAAPEEQPAPVEEEGTE